MTRRNALSLLFSEAASTAAPTHAQAPAVSLGFSLYGMKDLPVLDALRVCSRIGYDGVELCLMPGWSAPNDLDATARASLRAGLLERKLGLLALMEQLSLLEREMPKQIGVDRLKKAAELGHALSPSQPLIETVLGGKPADWQDSKGQLVERLEAWAETAKSTDCLLCVKAHAGAAVDTPDKLTWLYHQVNHPNLKLTYDYSHFQAAGLPLPATLQTIIHDARFIHLKDAKGTADHPQFLLAGDGGVDYEEYFRLLKAARYSGPIVAEVSAQLQRVKGYDAEAAAAHSYERVARAASATGLQRVGHA